jgi:IS5 family transposase
MSASRPATPPMPSASSQCSSGKSLVAACHRGRVAADGGYASQDNLASAKERGVTDVAFHKKRGLAVEDMVKSRWVYRKLRNFRAGIEAGISCLKRAYGLARCTWRGLDHFKTYIWSAVMAHNLVLLARLKPA